MRSRPRERFLKKLRKEKPPDELLDKLINNYRAGGIQFEEDIAEHLRGTPIKMSCVSDVRTRRMTEWRYVGETWWARYIDRGEVLGKYEFARFVAIINEGECDQIEGMWDERRHAYRTPPVIVYDGDRKGQISAYSEFEIYVAWWENGELLPGRPFEEPDKLRFEFIEDYKYYRPIISKITKR
jgi:hypothetical protein